LAHRASYFSLVWEIFLLVVFIRIMGKVSFY
jgi:hypothetical protein